MYLWKICRFANTQSAHNTNITEEIVFTEFVKGKDGKFHNSWKTILRNKLILVDAWKLWNRMHKLIVKYHPRLFTSTGAYFSRHKTDVRVLKLKDRFFSSFRFFEICRVSVFANVVRSWFHLLFCRVLFNRKWFIRGKLYLHSVLRPHSTT